MSLLIWFLVWSILSLVVVVALGRCVAPGSDSDAKEARFACLTQPHSGPGALALSIMINTTILVSLVTMTLSSVKSIKDRVPGILDVLEWWFLAVFSFEWLGLLMYCPDLPAQLCTGAVWIDALAVVPSFLSIVLNDNQLESLVALRVARLFRIFRLFKFMAKSKKMRTIFLALQETLPTVGVSFLMLGITLYIPSVFMYHIEQGDWDDEMGCFRRGVPGEDCSPFQDIIEAMYWGAATVTTVGYGDVFPVTPLGKFVAVVCMVFGIVSLSLPIGMMSSSFIDAMTELKKQDQLLPKRRHTSGGTGSPDAGDRELQLRPFIE